MLVKTTTMLVMVSLCGCTHRPVSDLADGAVGSTRLDKLTASGTVCTASTQTSNWELIVSNTSVLQTGGSSAPDSDRDGLSDKAEGDLGTCPGDPDTDGDGVGDLLEVKLASSPLVADSPAACLALQSTQKTGPAPCSGKTGSTGKTWTAYSDTDRDGLNDCEELLLGTDRSRFDSDADGLPDQLEVRGGSNPVQSDALQDADSDGAVNRSELRQHTDPLQPTSQSIRDELAYRITELDQGLQELRTSTQPGSISGVSIRGVSPHTSPGVGILRFEPGPPPTLAWRDVADATQGFGAAVDVTSAADFTLNTCCGTASKPRFVVVRAQGSAAYPITSSTEKVSISGRMARCVEFRVENITLLETKPVAPWKQGDNIITVDIAFGTKDKLPVHRVASVVVNYLQGPGLRVPASGRVTLYDDDFVTP